MQADLGPDESFSVQGQTPLLRAIVEGSDDAIVTKTLEGIVTSWNPAAEQIFGYTAAEMIGEPITRIFPPDRFAEEADFLRRLARGEHISHYETVRVRKDGRALNISVTLSPLRDASGRIVGVSKIARDITDRKRFEAADRAQAEWRRVMLASIGDALIATDGRGHVTYMNPVAESLTGWRLEDAAGRPLAEVFRIVNEQTRQAVESPVDRVLREGTVVGLANHTALYARDGQERLIDDSAAPILTEDGQTVGVVLVFRDVSARRRAQAETDAVRKELAHRVAALTHLAEVSTRLVPTGDLQGLLPEILDAAIRITQADMGNIQLRDAHTGLLEIAVQRGFTAEFLEFFASVSDPDSAAYAAAMRAGQRVVVGDVAQEPLLAGTKAREILLRAEVRAVQSTPLWSRSGDMVGMLSTHYRQPRRPDERDLQLLDVLARLAADYIERVRTERDAAAAHAALEAADRAKDDFLAMLGHELRNPLGAIVGALGVLEIVGNEAEPAEHARAVIGRQVRQLSRLVDDLLDVSRVTAGKVVLTRRPLDLANVVASALQTVQSSGRLNRRQVAVDTSPTWVNGDETRMEQVLSNLLGNALKYTRADGRIAIRVFPDGDTAVLEVADDGIGIPSYLLQKIFDAFVQGDRTLDRAQGGLGLGLTLVKALVTMHGGTVDARSVGAGNGSTFTVRLPLASSVALPSDPVTSEVSGTVRRRILLIEDNEDARAMLKLLLVRRGHEVHDTGDGLAGIAMAGALGLDIALIDVGLPGLDGYEVARRIRAGKNGQSLRLIALTGYGQVEDRRRAFEAGFDTHHTKPISLDDLLEEIG